MVSGVDLDVDPIESDLGTETLHEGAANDDAHRPNLSGAPSPLSSGVLIKGQSTKGPAKKSSNVATTSVMTRPPGCGPERPPAPRRRAPHRRCPRRRRGGRSPRPP